MLPHTGIFPRALATQWHILKVSFCSSDRRFHSCRLGCNPDTSHCSMVFSAGKFEALIRARSTLRSFAPCFHLPSSHLSNRPTALKRRRDHCTCSSLSSSCEEDTCYIITFFLTNHKARKKCIHAFFERYAACRPSNFDLYIYI